MELLRTVAKQPEDGPMVHCYGAAVDAVYGLRSRGEFELVARIASEIWCEPRLETAEDWAPKLANRVARDL